MPPLKRNGTMAAAVIFEYRNGVLCGRRHYRLECKLEDDETEIFRQMVVQWYMDVEFIPGEIATDVPLPTDMAERESIEQALASKTTHKVVLTNPQRGEKLGFLKLASANADVMARLCQRARWPQNLTHRPGHSLSGSWGRRISSAPQR